MKKKLYRYRWLLAFIAGFTTSIIISVWFFKEDLNTALCTSAGGAIGFSIAMFLNYYYEKKKMHKAEKVKVSDTTMRL
jgi:hypothetical protein